MYQKKEFAKAQVAAFIGTAVDYMTVILLTEWVGLWYVYSNTVGAACGAVTNFLLGRNWAFEAMDGVFLHQALRYALVSFGSLLLNTAGVY
ncbi:MAG: GtrA family protein, partial [Bacteroidota bacterium]